MKSSKINFIFLLLITWYLFLAATHYLNQRPMWNDEEAVFASVSQFSDRQIFTQPLLAVQVFPRVYLFLIQKVTNAFGPSTHPVVLDDLAPDAAPTRGVGLYAHLWALRLLPFLAMLSAFACWMKIARREFKTEPVWRLTYIMSWSASALLIYYAAELKQYSMDVLAGAITVLVLYAQGERYKIKDKPVLSPAMALLPFLGLFSYPAFLWTLLPLYNGLLSARHPVQRKGVVLYIVGFVVASALAYNFDIRLRHEDVVSRTWGDYFISTQSVGEFFKTWGEGSMNLFSRWFVERPRVLKRIAVGFLCFGFVHMIYTFLRHFRQEGGRIFSLKTIGFPVYLMLVMLGILHLYPFTVPRTSLFFCPVVLYHTVCGLAAVRKIHVYLYYIVFLLFWMYLVFVSSGIAQHIFSGDLGALPLVWGELLGQK